MATYRPPKMKSISSTFLEYDKLLKQTGVRLPEMEALRPFLGKKGQVLKRATRSKKQQAALEKAVKNFREKYGRGGKKKIKNAVKVQQAKNREKLKKAKATFRQHQKEKAGPGANFRSIAQKASNQYGKMVKAFADEMLQQLRQQYDMGSSIIQWMTEKYLTNKEMARLISLLGQAWEDIPLEAQELAQRDNYWEVTLAIMQSGKTEDFSFMLQNYIEQETEGRGDDFLHLLNEFDESESDRSFRDVWQQLQEEYSEDPYNPNNLYEVLNND